MYQGERAAGLGRPAPLVVVFLGISMIGYAQEPIVGLPCEGCEAVFEGLPDALSAVARLAPADEPGEPMRIVGTIRDAEGHPAAGVIVYAYHTDAHGIYPRDERLSGTTAYRHGRLRGWVVSDANGRYRFDTIRPAQYPQGETPAHVHMHVIEPGCCTYYIASIHFTDDRLLSATEREALWERVAAAQQDRRSPLPALPAPEGDSYPHSRFPQPLIQVLLA